MRARRNAHDSAKTDYGLDCGRMSEDRVSTAPTCTVYA